MSHLAFEREDSHSMEPSAPRAVYQHLHSLTE